LHRLISSREAAKRLGVSQATVLRAVARRTLTPAETTPGGHRRFLVEDVDAFAVAAAPNLVSGTRLISSGAAARLLGVSQHTVMRACREGRLEADEVTPGGHHRFSETRIRELAPRVYELVGTGSAARALGLTVNKLLRAVQRGTVSLAAVTPGGHRRFSAVELSSCALLSNGNGSGNADGDGGSHATS
jgi:excisionase family DNA binding protein